MPRRTMPGSALLGRRSKLPFRLGQLCLPRRRPSPVDKVICASGLSRLRRPRLSRLRRPRLNEPLVPADLLACRLVLDLPALGAPGAGLEAGAPLAADV